MKDQVLRLGDSTLETFAGGASLPGYDRDSIGIGIVHLGIGAFHRAHQACYTEAVLNRLGGNWGICGVSLRSTGVRDSLAPQNYLYTLATKQDEQASLQVIGAIKKVLVAPEQPSAVVEQLADPGVTVVTLTITEKGYCLNPATGELALDEPGIAFDLENPQQPKTAIGFLVAGLQHRRNAGGRGMTLISCDNLASNGKQLRRAVLAFAQQLDPSLADWIDKQCTFPCTMVDRIVPAATDADRKRVVTDLGFSDAAAIATEPFSQWVIENDFADAVPEWSAVGPGHMGASDA